MDRRPAVPPVAIREYLHVARAEENLHRRSVTPVTLERRWLIMETSSSSSVDPTVTTDTTNSTRTTTTATSSTASLTAVTSASSSSNSYSTATMGKQPAVQTSTTTPSGTVAALPAASITAASHLTTHTCGGADSHSSKSAAGKSPSPSRSMFASAAEQRTTASAASVPDSPETTAHVSGEALKKEKQKQRPQGAADTVSSTVTSTGHGDASGSMLLPPEATPRGLCKPPSASSSTRKQEATREELRPPQPGRGLRIETTDTLSTGDQPSPRRGKPGDRGRELARRTTGSGRNADESSPRPSPRAVGDVMQFFAEQEKNLQESFLALPKKSVKKQRSPSPKINPAAGLEHLDHLVRLMEQLGSLKDENSRLRQRCQYLESTKVLLQARKDLAGFEAGVAQGRRQHQKQRHHHHHHHHHHHQVGAQSRNNTSDAFEDADAVYEASGYQDPSARRSRVSSSEDLDLLQFVDSSSDQRPKRPKSGLQKRSYSTGSIEIPAGLLIGDVGDGETRKRFKAKVGRSIFSKSGAKSKSSKSGSKWARVKKVLTGQKLYEDLGTTIRSLRELGRSTGARYSTSEVSCSPPSARISSSEGRYTDPGLGATSEPLHRPPLVVVPLIHHAETDPASRSEQEVSDSDLTCDIWMGPPDWWEEYEAGRQQEGNNKQASANNSDVSSVIEVTTMYLGGAKSSSSPNTTTSTAASSSLLATSMTASTLSSSSTATPSSPASPHATSAVTTIPPAEDQHHAQQQLLSVSRHQELVRRQSSPSLNGREAAAAAEREAGDILDELAHMPDNPVRMLHKSSSCQSADLDIDGLKGKGQHRTAWGRVKDMIRKDSVKRRPKKQRSEPRGGASVGRDGDSEETSEIDMEGLLVEEQWRSTSFGESVLGRSTPKSSPIIARQQSQSQSQVPTTLPAPQGNAATRGMDVAAMLAGQMSDDFNRKMQEWEAMKSRKSSSFKGVTDDSEMGSLDVSVASQDVVDLRDLKGKVPDSSSDGTTPVESHTSLEVLGAPTPSAVHLEEIQRRMTESFSKKMQEWEKLKYRPSLGSTGSRDPTREAGKEPSSPEMERKAGRTRKEERGKSKRSREDKERERLEKMREREMQKVEKEQVKLEKEKLRLEKERLRALEREAKLEKLKGRLSSAELETGPKNPVLGPLAEYKVTADFAHKLHQWELKKGLSHDVSNSIYLEAQKLNMQNLSRESTRQNQQRLSLSPNSRIGEDSVSGGDAEEEEEDKGRNPHPLTLQPYWGTPEDRSPIDLSPGVGLGREEVEGDADADVEGEGDGDDETATSVTEECLAKSNIVTLERANQQLIENLEQKEIEYADVQQQVDEVNRKLAKVKEEHAKEIARFHRELALGSIAEPVKLEVGELESTIQTMEDKIKAMEDLGERLAVSMESAAVGKWQSIDGEEAVHSQLIELVDQMRNMLVQASQSDEHSKKSMALSNFEKLYSHAMKLQVQMNNLRLSHLERNREIMTVKRQLLLQEVNNLLLQADITRRETELYQYQAAKQFASLKRFNTFSGSDRKQRPQIEKREKPGTEPQGDNKTKAVDAPHVNIPYISESVSLASAASSSLSAPASPSAIEAAGGTPGTQSGTSGKQYLNPGVSSSEASGAPSPSTTHQHPSRHHEQHHPPSQVAASRSESELPIPQENLPSQSASPSLVRAVSDPQRGRKNLSTYAGECAKETSASPSLGGHLSQPLQPEADSLKQDQTAGHDGGTRATCSLEFKKDSYDKAQATHVQTIDTPTEYQTDKNFSQERVEATGATSEAPQSTSQNPQNLEPSATTRKGVEFRPSKDSAPIFKELKELRKAKSLMERGSPVLIMRHEGRGSSSVPSPAKSHSQKREDKKSHEDAPTPTIPQQQGAVSGVPSQVPRLVRAAASIDQDDLPATVVVEGLKPGQSRDPDAEPDCASAGSIVTTRLSPRSDTRRGLPPTSDSGRQGKCPRSPVTKHNYLRRQKEERDTNSENKSASPTSSPVATRGKPPLPRQNTPVRQSPQASPIVPDKGPRSKSVGEMSQGRSGSGGDSTSKPLQEAISKFEKRQTMCETEERPMELRKTPSPTLHLPRVGLVSRVRRLKPAAELLEESQRYRSGHSIYATRILQRYLPKDDSSGIPVTGGATSVMCAPAQNKENTYVHAMVHRLSRETSPVKSVGSSRTNSDLSLKRTDSPRSNSEFVSHIVRKLSNGSGSGSPRHKGSNSSPLKDRTNDGQVKRLAQSFDDSPERTLSDSNLGELSPNQQVQVPRRATPSSRSATKSQNRKSCEAALIISSSTAVPCSSSLRLVASKGSEAESSLQHDIYHSEAASSGAGAASPTRVRAATYSERAKREAERETPPARPASTSTPLQPPPTPASAASSSGSRSPRTGSKSSRSPTSSISPVRRGTGRGKGGTVGVLCKQSISFDLGVHLYAQKAQSAAGGSPKSTRQVKSWDPGDSFASDTEITTHSEPGPSRESRPVSSGSEGEPTQSPSHSEERNKFRRFLDSNWLQKSKRFFKVSK